MTENDSQTSYHKLEHYLEECFIDTGSQNTEAKKYRGFGEAWYWWQY